MRYQSIPLAVAVLVASVSAAPQGGLTLYHYPDGDYEPSSSQQPPEAPSYATPSASSQYSVTKPGYTYGYTPSSYYPGSSTDSAPYYPGTPSSYYSASSHYGPSYPTNSSHVYPQPTYPGYPPKYDPPKYDPPKYDPPKYDPPKYYPPKYDPPKYNDDHPPKYPDHPPNYYPDSHDGKACYTTTYTTTYYKEHTTTVTHYGQPPNHAYRPEYTPSPDEYGKPPTYDYSSDHGEPPYDDDYPSKHIPYPDGKPNYDGYPPKHVPYPDGHDKPDCHTSTWYDHGKTYTSTYYPDPTPPPYGNGPACHTYTWHGYNKTHTATSCSHSAPTYDHKPTYYPSSAYTHSNPYPTAYSSPQGYEPSTTSAYEPDYPASSSAAAATHTVTVGGPGILAYDPPYVRANAGDKLRFEFLERNHTVTESTYESPCSPKPDGFDTGFVPNLLNEPPSGDQIKYYTVADSDPKYFYCQQGDHCASGMVFALNPSAEHPYEKYREGAMAPES